MEMMNWIWTFLKEFVGLINEMAPYLLLGFLFAGILKVVFPRKIISRYLGGRNFKSVFNASLLGVPMPLCSCGVLPTGIGFYKQGASRGASVSFLISTPQTGVDSILATYAMMGLPLAIIRPVVALSSGVLGGWIANLADSKKKDSVPLEETDEVQERSFRALFRYGFVELIQEISKWLIIGMLAAAFLAVIIPADFFTETIQNEYLAMLMMLLASVPLYICATGSIPIAAVLLLKGLSPGAALVLLMAGPATNLATMAVIGKTMGRRTLVVYLASIIGGAVLFGTLVNELIPRHWIMDALPAGLIEGMHDHGQPWWIWVSSALLVLLMINAFLRKWIKDRRTKSADREKAMVMEQVLTFRVEGMTCKNCKAKVEDGLEKLPGVSQAIADPSSNQLTLDASGISEEAVRSAVEGLGYSYKGRIIRF